MLSRLKSFLLVLLTLWPYTSFSSETLAGLNDSESQKAICGPDRREASKYAPIMRLRPTLEDQEISCTGFMISKRCALTAGHCEKSTVIAEFNVPESDGRDFSAAPSRAEDIYQVNQRSIERLNHRTGADFAVLRLEKNPITGLYPGEAQGYLEIDYITPNKGDLIKIVGYGASYASRERFLTQKFDTGEVVSTFYRRAYPFIRNLSSISYRAGSTGGDSGAPIIDKNSGRAIGIHNAGSCIRRTERNSGTLFDRQTRLTRAIERCLNEE